MKNILFYITFGLLFLAPSLNAQSCTYFQIPSNGTGSSLDPYQIANFEELNWISLHSDEWDKHFVLTSDISAILTADSCFNTGKGWSPIGSQTIPFTGSFNGNSFAISYLNIDLPTTSGVGLFGVINNATIENLQLSGINIIGYRDVGGLTGRAENGSIINNCEIDGVIAVFINQPLSMIPDNVRAGGLVGTLTDSEVSSCNVNVNLNSDSWDVGGIVGIMGNTVISESTASGSISIDSGVNSIRARAGGIAGFAFNQSEINACYAQMNIVHNGFNGSDGVNSTSFRGIGGLIGGINNATIVRNCYSYSTIHATNDGSFSPIGGLIGNVRSNATGMVLNCYATGSVFSENGEQHVGGLIGKQDIAITVNGSFWNLETTGISSSSGGVGLATAEMKERTTYITAGWDFQCESENGSEDIWGINDTDNTGYPFLSWQGFTHEVQATAGTVSPDQLLCSGESPENVVMIAAIGDIQWQSSTDNSVYQDIPGANEDTLFVAPLNLQETHYFRAVVGSGSCRDTSDVVTVVIATPTTDTIDVVMCDNYIAPDGQEYGEDGQFIAVIPNQAGCDSTIIINLTVLASVEVTINAESCNAYIAPDNEVYTTSGQYLAVLPRANGCDSLITINLIIHENSSSTISEEACNEYVAPDGQIYTESGQYTAILPSSAGCDSVITINLTISASTLALSYTAVAATPGFANGTATVLASGGVSPYTYQWNDPFMQTTATVWGVFPGTWYCEVSDAAGCNMTISVFVPIFTGIPTTQLSSLHCDGIDYVFDDVISANSISDASAYRWLFTAQGGSSLPEYTRNQSNPHLRLGWITGLEMGQVYDVRVKAQVGDEWSDYGEICTITMSANVPQTQVHTNYTPFNLQNKPYQMCDVVSANSVYLADNYRWRFDPDSNPENGNELNYERGTGNPAIRIQWVDGLVPGTLYNVQIQARVNGVWGNWGTALPVQMGPASDVALRPAYCNQIYSTNQSVVSTSGCGGEFWEFLLINTTNSDAHTILSSSTAGHLNQATPALIPGATYSVSVRISQNGILGDFSTSCNITIAGPQAQGEETPTIRTMAVNSATLYPNPNAGTEVRVELSGLGDGNHEVMIQIYDVYGKLIQTDGFGHAGSAMSRLIRFDGTMAMGMYMVQIVVDGERFTTERLIIK